MAVRPIALHSYNKPTYLNQLSTSVAESFNIVLQLRIAAPLIPVYVTGWHGHGFKQWHN